MWRCPTCNREFKVLGQHHFCTNKPTDIDSYNAMQREEVKEDLLLAMEGKEGKSWN